MHRVITTGDDKSTVPDEGGVALQGDVTLLKGRFSGRAVKRVSVKAMDQAIGDEVAASFESCDKDLRDATSLEKKP